MRLRPSRLLSLFFLQPLPFAFCLCCARWSWRFWTGEQIEYCEETQLRQVKFETWENVAYAKKKKESCWSDTSLVLFLGRASYMRVVVVVEDTSPPPLCELELITHVTARLLR